MKARTLGVAIALIASGCSSPTAPPIVHGPRPIDPVHEGQTSEPARVVTEPRSLAPFDSVSLSGVGRLVIRQTGSESLTLTADEHLLPLMTSEVRGGCLYLGVAPGSDLDTPNEITWRLTVISLDEIRLAGATRAEARDLGGYELTIAQTGATWLELSGSVQRQSLTIAGTSVYRGENLDSREASVQVSGVSHAVVRVSDRLTGRVTGVSLLEYIGDPEVIVSVTEEARVRRL